MTLLRFYKSPEDLPQLAALLNAVGPDAWTPEMSGRCTS